ncbi:hypothetical protein [Gorillibacterium sp. CAU 1737]|uniref:hypothetical protein n=1 Tax=Gorillibacterium sp. CAU 1737 TaxID=3140362 RepID=UPI003261C5CD
MAAYDGIIIGQSLKNPALLKQWNILTQKQQGGWTFLWVSVPEGEFGDRIADLQKSMIPMEEDCWYNHFFQDDTLFVVYQDAVFRTTTNPQDWTEVVEYGLRHGVPTEQLDFNPCTRDGAARLFGDKGRD